MTGEPIPSATSMDVSDDRLPATRILRAAAEAVLFLTIFGGVWAFGGDLPEWEFVLALGVSLLTGIWVTRCVLYRRLSLRPDFVSSSLAGMVLISALQLVPLPLFLVSILSPGTAHVHTTYRPAVEEKIQGEEGEPASRPNVVAMSLDTSLTRKFLTQILAILLVYSVCRNWLSSRGAFRRFAWIATVSGFLLALFAFIQYFSAASPGLMYGNIQTGGVPFGPFVNRNHYPFFLTPCIGLGVALLLTAEKSVVQQSSSSASGSGLKGAWYDFTSWLGQASQSPRDIGLLGMLSIMLLSIPFSLSRGGLISILLAGAVTAAVWYLQSDFKNRPDRAGVGAVIALGLAVFGVATVLSWSQVEQRVATLGKGGALETRLPLWKDSLRLLPDFPVFGTGGGTFIRAEPMVRTTGDSQLRHDNAHNEYVEALVEGGLVRFFLTLLLVYGAIATTARGYRRLAGRSTGNLLLGTMFGLTTVALHSFGEFGIHVPAVGLLIAALAGYAAAAADDPDYAPTKRTKHGLSGATHAEFDLPRTGEHRTRVRAAVVLTGPPALGGLAVVAVVAGLIAWEFRTWDLAERLRSEVVIQSRDSQTKDHDKRIKYFTARCRVIPDEPNAFLDLAQAHFDAALDLDKNLKSDGSKAHVFEGLKANRSARNLCPVFPNPHFRFGLYKQQDEQSPGRWFVSAADPARVYFERAAALLPLDPEVWYAAGVEAYERNDRPGAWKNWQKSLALSDRQLEPILSVARKLNIDSDTLLREILPRDPTILIKAADALYPNPDDEESGKKRDQFVAQAEQILKTKSNPTVPEIEVLARISDERGNVDSARTAWRRAVNADPENVGLRDRFATWLEGKEFYEEAIPHLEWLKAQGAGGRNITVRIELAKRSDELMRGIAPAGKSR